MDNYEIALEYKRKGFSPFPIWSPESLQRINPAFHHTELGESLNRNSEQEHPAEDEIIEKQVLIRMCKRAFVSWKPYQKNFATDDEIKKWFKENPDLNIGIVTGKISNLIVLDLDSVTAYEWASKQGLPKTPTVKTGKGWQLYFKYPGFDVKNNTNTATKVDIKSEGGYVVAPPSVHGSGREYEWEEGCSIFDIDPADCPDWLINYLKSLNSEKTTPKEKNKDSPGSDNQNPEKKSFARILTEGCVYGERNNVATSLIGHYFAKGLDEDEIWVIAQAWNANLKPPMSESELKRIFKSAREMEKKNRKKEENINIESLLDTVQTADKEYNQEYVRIPFAGDNLKSLENITNGGLAGGRLYVLGGIPSAGKTTVMNNIADNICSNDYPVLFFSYDDGRAELRYRTLARFGPHCIEDYNLKRLEGIKSVFNIEPVKKIMSLKYVVQNNIPVEKWSDLIEKIRTKHGKAPVIFIDYLRKLKTDSKTSDERLRVDDIISKLSDLAKKYNIPIVVISELARDSYKSGQRLSMASFKESGNIEYSASWLGILGAVEEINGEYQLKENWDKIIEQDGNIEVMIFKAKRGTGNTGVVHLKVDRDKMTVKDRPVEKLKSPKRVETVFG